MRTVGDKVPSRFPQWMREVGVEIYSTCTGFRYARNGNAHNPTPDLSYVAVYGGKIVTMARTLREAKATVAEVIDQERTDAERISRDSDFGFIP